MKVLVAQPYLTLWFLMDCTLLGFLVHENILGRNIGVGCYFLLQGTFQTQGLNTGVLHCSQILYSVSSSVVCDSLWPHGLQHASILCPWDFPSKITGVGCHFLLTIFLTKRLNPGLLHCRQILYHLNHEESLRFFIVYQ